MGFLTTIMIRNDAMEEIRKDPEGFSKKLLETIDEASMDGQSKGLGFGHYCNMATVHPSSHADVQQLYLHIGNTLINICPYSNDFKRMLGKNTNFLKRSIEAAQRFITEAKKQIKEKS